MHDAVKVAAVLGIDPNRVEAESMTLEPLENGSWIVRWNGFGWLDAEAARILFGDHHDHAA